MRFLPLTLAVTGWLALAGLGVAAPAVGAAAVPTVRGQFAPTDSCTMLADAAAFRQRLAAAVRSRDVAAFVSLTSPDIRLDFGGGEGHEALIRRLTGEEGDQLWRELEELLPLGCAAQGENLVIPAIFAQDLGGVDPFDALIVTGERVALRAAPSAGARPVRLLTWTLVETVTGDDHDAPYRHVRLPGGEVTGYVSRTFLRSPLDYRVIARRIEGEWTIEAFLAGD